METIGLVINRGWLINKLFKNILNVLVYMRNKLFIY